MACLHRCCTLRPIGPIRGSNSWQRSVSVMNSGIGWGISQPQIGCLPVSRILLREGEFDCLGCSAHPFPSPDKEMHVSHAKRSPTPSRGPALAVTSQTCHFSLPTVLHRYISGNSPRKRFRVQRNCQRERGISKEWGETAVIGFSETQEHIILYEYALLERIQVQSE